VWQALHPAPPTLHLRLSKIRAKLPPSKGDAAAAVLGAVAGPGSSSPHQPAASHAGPPSPSPSPSSPNRKPSKSRSQKLKVECLGARITATEGETPDPYLKVGMENLLPAWASVRQAGRQHRAHSRAHMPLPYRTHSRVDSTQPNSFIHACVTCVRYMRALRA
jgi:hypothetical protein